MRVHERNAELRAFGAGIFVWENGLRVLQAIGAYDDVVRGSHDARIYEDRHENRVTAQTHFSIERGSRLLTMTRQHLYRAILTVARSLDIEIHTSSAVAGATPDGVLMLDSGQRLPADLVVGADGVRSRVRDSLGLPVERDTREHGIVRVLVPRCLDELGPDTWDYVIDFWNLDYRSLRILYVPCNEQELYLALMAPADDREASAMPLNSALWIEGFPQLAPVLEKVPERGRYDVYETGKLDQWSMGRVAIVGDAAHAMVPSLGQGAGVAMMNALSLAVALEGTETIEEALATWEREERPMTEHTQDQSDRAARERLVTRASIWNDMSLRTAWHIPTGTEHLPHPLI